MLNNQEQIIRKVTGIGNGAHIFAPKEWLGEEVMIVRTVKSLKEKIFSVLKPHLGNISGVYLYGSHARGEAEQGSDVDLLVISSKKMKIKSKGYEIIALREDDFAKAIKIAPILMYSMLSEAMPIINDSLLQRLKNKYKPRKSEFISYLEETENVLKVNEGLISKKENLEAVAYSVLLRLKGVCIVKCLLSKKKYSNMEFESWLEKNLPSINLAPISKAYKLIKRNKNGKVSLSAKDLSLLLALLDKELAKLKW